MITRDNPHIKTYTKDDLYTMARTLWGEARGEQFGGQVAVAWVIRNRADNPKWWGSSISQVCRKKFQFSCWLPTDPNRDKLMMIELPDRGFATCLIICAQVLAGQIPDNTKGANHYHVASIKPTWAEGQEPTCRHGNHVFYKL